jgi:hypothetical protein
MLGVSEAVQEVIVHHAHRLHEGLGSDGANEPKALLSKLQRNLPGKLSLGRDLIYTGIAVDNGRSADSSPQVVRKSRPATRHYLCVVNHSEQLS